MNSNPASASPVPRHRSLVADTADCLRAGIRSGRWRDLLPGERKLAGELQVGRNTLRAALSQLERSGWLSSCGNRRRSICATDRKESSNQRQIVAIVSPSIPLHLASRSLFLLDVLRDTLSRAGFATGFHADSKCFSSSPNTALKKLITAQPASVWILLSSHGPAERWFARQKIPCLVVGSASAEFALPSIDVDHRALSRHAGGFLLRKGHRRICLVLPRDSFGGERERERGLREALATTPNACVEVLRHDGGAGHLCSLLDGSLAQKEPPTAFLVARAKHANAVMMHLLRRGHRIPEDLAVISADDDPFLEAVLPEVTRYTIDTEKFARRLSKAARQLIESGMLPASAIREMPEFLPGETA